MAEVLVLAACGGMKSPSSVADKFVDRYYVESYQSGALPLATGVATLRLQEELRLTAEARRPGGPQMPLRQVRVYYSRKSLSGEGRTRTAEYELDIRPQGGERSSAARSSSWRSSPTAPGASPVSRRRSGLCPRRAEAEGRSI
jgi:hypothetical protein